MGPFFTQHGLHPGAPSPCLLGGAAAAPLGDFRPSRKPPKAGPCGTFLDPITAIAVNHWRRLFRRATEHGHAASGLPMTEDHGDGVFAVKGECFPATGKVEDPLPLKADRYQ